MKKLLVVLAVLAGIVLSGCVGEDNKMPSPILWSKLEDTDDVTSPQLGTGGSEIGSPTYAAGKFGNGILVNVNDEGCKFPTSDNSINISKGYIEVWWIPQYDSDPGEGNHGIWDFHPSASGYGIYLETTGDTIRALIYKGGSILEIHAEDQSWTSGDLIHLAVTWDRLGNDIGGGKTAALYKDDVEMDSSTLTWSAGSVNPDLHVGHFYSGSYNANAIIDNIKTGNVCKTDYSDRGTEDGNNAPTVPTLLLCEGETNPPDVSDLTPEFSAIFNDPDSGDKANAVEIHVATTEEGLDSPDMWDSGWIDISSENLVEGNRCNDQSYAGSSLSLGDTYYWKIRFRDDEDAIGMWSSAAEFTMWDKEAPWKEDILEPTGEVKVEIPRRSGEWTTLENVMRIHTSNGKDTSSPRAPIEIGQAEVTCSNIDKDFNSFEEASDWYKNLEGYAVQIKVGCKVEGSPISVKLFTGIISSVNVDRLSQTAEIRVVDFLDYFGRITIEETPVWEGISLTQLFKNLVQLVFPEWVEGTDYFVEDLGGSTIPAIGYTDLNLLSELKMIAESRGKRIYTDPHGRLHCASRNPERDPLTVSYDYNLEDVTERRNIDSIINWVEVHARPHEIQPDTTPPGKVSGFTATPGDQKIDLSWSNPTDDDFDKVRIVYSTSAYPTNEGEGTQIYEGTGISKSHTGLTNGTRYYYSAFTADDTGNWSDAAHTSAVAGVGEDTWGDETETSPVTNFEAEAGHEKITLTWMNPKTADFSLVEIRWSTTDYPGSVTDGSQLYQGTAQTKVHSGLTIGTRYYYAAFAQNSGGEWSRGVHASAVPGLEGGGTDGEFREELATYSVRDSHYAWQDAKDYFSSWTYKKKFNFRIPYGRYTASWLRFKHHWDIKCYADMKYISNQKHVSGQKDDLTLNSTHDCNEIAICKTVYISLYSSAVSIFMEYTLSYKGGNIKEIHINNTLSLMG